MTNFINARLRYTSKTLETYRKFATRAANKRIESIGLIVTLSIEASLGDFMGEITSINHLFSNFKQLRNDVWRLTEMVTKTSKKMMIYAEKTDTNFRYVNNVLRNNINCDQSQPKGMCSLTMNSPTLVEAILERGHNRLQSITNATDKAMIEYENSIIDFSNSVGLFINSTEIPSIISSGQWEEYKNKMFKEPLDNLLRMIASKLIRLVPEKLNDPGLRFCLKGLHNTACFSHVLSAVVLFIIILLAITFLLYLKRAAIRTLITLSFLVSCTVTFLLAAISVINLLSFGIETTGLSILLKTKLKELDTAIGQFHALLTNHYEEKTSAADFLSECSKDKPLTRAIRIQTDQLYKSDFKLSEIEALNSLPDRLLLTKSIQENVSLLGRLLSDELILGDEIKKLNDNLMMEITLWKRRVYETQKISDLTQAAISHSSFEEEERSKMMKKLSESAQYIDKILKKNSHILTKSNRLRFLIIQLKKEIGQIEYILTKFSSQFLKAMDKIIMNATKHVEKSIMNVADQLYKVQVDAVINHFGKCKPIWNLWRKYVHGKFCGTLIKSDSLMIILKDSGLQPGFELMGNPSGFYTNFENKTQVYFWADLIRQIASRYIHKFGITYVKEWIFETWNEPDNHDFDHLNFTTKGFLNYIDACRKGLNLAHSDLKLAVIGGDIKPLPRRPFANAILTHYVNGTDFFDGNQPQICDLITFHNKGNDPNNTKVLIKKYFLSEADPLVGWNKDREWRGDARYAALVIKIIYNYINKFGNRRKFPMKLLSNDNAFLSYNPFFFTQRTILARFQINNTNPHHVQFIPKPVFNSFALLAYLGNKELYSKVESLESTIGIIASSLDSNELSILLYNSNDSANSTSGHTKVKVQISELSKLFGSGDVDLMKVQYTIDNWNTNPYKIWRKLGSPKTPNHKQLLLMKDASRLYRQASPRKVSVKYLTSIAFDLALPSISLYHVYAITTNRCIKTYEVMKKTPSGKFSRINVEDTIFNFYEDASGKNTGKYKVRAVDYWNRNGPFSETAKSL
ncbi:DgyrCDS5446 [Dimorphilus gyrociliatus]|uniref:DgyrCDS5446 n=1 Tax=Dimorphilus gyrociliatus TaxID=2664684 RepID=A0A7I8VK20_9ANNE|nr:DgyrCDS5446 [Dimorphilus gyrociliatus]